MSMEIREHDCVVLTRDMDGGPLRAGDVGTVVHIHGGGEAFEVEFLTMTGRTVSVTTVFAADLRLVSASDISHVRELASN